MYGQMNLKGIHSGKIETAFELQKEEIYLYTSIALTNSRFPSPWVTKAVLTHHRGTCTVQEETFKEKKSPSRTPHI